MFFRIKTSKNSIARRVDRIEQSITTVIVKIDAAIKKLEGLDRMKMQHRERMSKLVQDAYSVQRLRFLDIVKHHIKFAVGRH